MNNYEDWKNQFDDGNLDELEEVFLEVEWEAHGDRAMTDSQNKQLLSTLWYRKTITTL